MLADLRFAFRTLRRTPIVTLVAILSLALGIGGNTAMFSLLDQILLRGLPVPDAGELVYLTANGPRRGSNSNNNAGNSQSIFSYPMFRDLEAKQTVLTGIAAHRSVSANVAHQRQTFNAQIAEVSGQYFPVLGVGAARGRLLGPLDDKSRGGHPVAVLSHAAWLKRFNGSDSILNQTLTANGVTFTVIGVAAEGFTGVTLGSMPELFVPLTMHEALFPTWKAFEQRQSYWVYLMARVKKGVSHAQAQSAMNVLFRGIINEVDAPQQKGASETFMKRFRSQELVLRPGEQGQSSIQSNASTPLSLLLGITGFVLLIACANIANLLLARAAGRSREMSIRLTVGAGRWQLVRQLLTEAMLIAVAGGLVGLAVSYATMRLILSAMPADQNLKLTADLDPRTLLFAMAVAISTGLLFGLFPALQSTKQDLVTALKDQAAGASGTGAAARLRQGLVAAQISLALMLLISAGLFLKSLVNVSRIDLGLRTGNIVSFGLSPELSKYTPEATRTLFERLEESLGALPGVTHVGASMVPLIAGNNWGSDVSIDGFEKGPDTDANSNFNEVGAGYFRALNVPILAGRDFTANDGPTSGKVAIVNEAFVKKFSPSSNILGKRMRTGRGEGKNDIEIVGVARNAKYSSVKDEIPPLFFLPYRQDKTVGASYFYVVTSLPPSQLMTALRRTVAQLDPNLPIEQLTTLSQQVHENIFVDRLITTLSAAFASLATLLAAIGLYGVLAFSVTRRTREIGIRLAIGAQTGTVRNLVLREVAILTVIGAAIAIPAAMALGKFAESLLFGMKGNDVAVFVGATLLVAAVSLAAGYFPARRAMRIDPMVALRYE
ncbi:MAG: ABC transporter permease [Bryobacteraceae bacterium]|nr:ABC transporter permease [Bryobacteraceae bacterium]